MLDWMPMERGFVGALGFDGADVGILGGVRGTLILMSLVSRISLFF